MNPISWLHISDMHFGHESQNEIWPTIKHRIIEDVERIVSLNDTIDFILCTGDVTYSGKQEQFKQADNFLTELWSNLNGIGSNPQFICIPGNHDLHRPPKLSSTARMLQKWNSEPDVRESLWSDKNGEYYTFVEKLYQEFMTWYSDTELPKPKEICNGYLPGDISCSITKNDFTLGIIGLNTSFLQFYENVKPGQIALSPIQINSVTDDDPDSWNSDFDLSILCTHHGPEWFSTEDKNKYFDLIYPKNRFFAHYFGHMHESMDLNFSKGSSDVQRMRQGISLFGTEQTSSGTKRIHGYSFNAISIEKGKLVETIYPRSTYKRQDNSIRLTPNMEYDLDDDNKIVRVYDCQIQNLGRHNSTLKRSPHYIKQENVIENNIVTKDLSKLKRPIPQLATSHQRIRQAELEATYSFINNKNFAWIISEWGMGKNGFLSNLLTSYETKDQIALYKIDCDEVDTIDQFYDTFVSEFGLEIHDFISSIDPDETTFIEFDNIGINFISNYGGQFYSQIKILIDYNPKLNFIFLSRYKFETVKNYSVELKPLNRLELQQYIEDHPTPPQELTSEDFFDEIQEKTSCIPMLVDNIIEQLQVVSLSDLNSFALYNKDASYNEPVPKSLISTINNIIDPADIENSKRCLALLKVLSFLPSGESLKKIERIYQKKPFRIEHAVRLQKLSLVTLSQFPFHFENIDGIFTPLFQTSEKILRVPRQVRDYINSLLTTAEKNDIPFKLADVLFGKNWRNGTVKIFKNEILSGRGVRSTGPGNEHETIKFLLSKRMDDSGFVNVALRTAASYCRGLYNANRYRDANLATKEILNITSGIDSPIKSELFLTRAQSLRMIGRSMECVEVLNNAISQNLINDKKRLKSAYLNLALAYQKIKQFDLALEAAHKVIDLSKNKDEHGLHARSIIIEIDNRDNTEALNKNLAHLYTVARNENAVVIANNICLTLANTTDNNNRIKYYDDVLRTDDQYNVIRASVDKTNYLFEIKEENKLTNQIINNVHYAYNWQYSQRITAMFNSCHKALWNVLIFEQKHHELLRLYKLSSLAWRLSNQNEKERQYNRKLNILIENAKIDGDFFYSFDKLYFISRKTKFLSLDR